MIKKHNDQALRAKPASSLSSKKPTQFYELTHALKNFDKNMLAFNQFIIVNKKTRISRTACLSTTIDSFDLYLVNL